MSKCNCSGLDDDLIEQGYTCYYCYENNKDVSLEREINENLHY